MNIVFARVDGTDNRTATIGSVHLSPNARPPFTQQTVSSSSTLLFSLPLNYFPIFYSSHEILSSCLRSVFVLITHPPLMSVFLSFRTLSTICGFLLSAIFFRILRVHSTHNTLSSTSAFMQHNSSHSFCRSPASYALFQHPSPLLSVHFIFIFLQFSVFSATCYTWFLLLQ